MFNNLFGLLQIFFCNAWQELHTLHVHKLSTLCEFTLQVIHRSWVTKARWIWSTDRRLPRTRSKTSNRRRYACKVCTNVCIAKTCNWNIGYSTRYVHRHTGEGDKDPMFSTSFTLVITVFSCPERSAHTVNLHMCTYKHAHVYKQVQCTNMCKHLQTCVNLCTEQNFDTQTRMTWLWELFHVVSCCFFAPCKCKAGASMVRGTPLSFTALSKLMVLTASATWTRV